MLHDKKGFVKFQIAKAKGRPRKHARKGSIVDIPIRLSTGQSHRDGLILPFKVVVTGEEVSIRCDHVRKAFGISDTTSFDLIAETASKTVVRMGKGRADATLIEYQPKIVVGHGIQRIPATRGRYGEEVYVLGPLNQFPQDGSVIWKMDVRTR